MIGKKGLLSSLPLVDRWCTKEQGPEPSRTPILSMDSFSVLCITFLYFVGVFVPSMNLCVIFVSLRGPYTTEPYGRCYLVTVPGLRRVI